MDANLTVKILDLPEVKKIIDEARDALFGANVEIDNLRKQLADAKAERERLRELAAEMLSHVRSGVPVHLPHARALSLHIDEVVVARWGEAFDLKPRPMCKPDPMGDVFPPSRSERGERQP
jgi:hypothetical protein